MSFTDEDIEWMQNHMEEIAVDVPNWPQWMRDRVHGEEPTLRLVPEPED